MMRSVVQYRRAFTLLEGMVCVAVMALLLAIAVSGISGARAASIRAKCFVNMRSAVAGVSAYCMDYDGRFPFGGDRPRVDYFRPEGAAWEHPIGGTFGLRGGMWAVLFSDDWFGATWNPALRCPRQPGVDPAAPVLAPPLDAESLPMPQYWLSSALWLDASSLDRLDRSYGMLRVRGNAVHDVTFPSSKVVMFEQIAFCDARPATRRWLLTGQTPFAITTFVTADGSARSMIRQDANPAVGSLPFDRTLDGVRGRDVP
jgi:prepilin-type N-terminal cleavage/methylation domain-containing protein